MKRWQLALLGVLVILIAVGLYRLRAEGVALEKSKAALQANLIALREENEYLASRMEYLKNPENVAKEIKTHLNYRRPDEKLLVIVRQATGTVKHD